MKIGYRGILSEQKEPGAKSINYELCLLFANVPIFPSPSSENSPRILHPIRVIERNVW